MVTEKTAGELEIDEDLSFQRRSWAIQRMGWGVMGLILLLALLGLLGPGPLSSRRAGDPGSPLEVKYNRFIRFQSDTEMKIQLHPSAESDGAVHLWLDREFLEQVQIKQVTPPPDRVEPGTDRLVYFYKKIESNGPTAITLYFEPQGIGRLKGRIGLGKDPAVTFSQFVYP